METKMSASIPSDEAIPYEENSNKTQVRNSQLITILISRPKGNE